MAKSRADRSTFGACRELVALNDKPNGAAAAVSDANLLRGIRILVVEDNPVIALDVAFAIEDAGGIVVGPAASVKEALVLIQKLPVAGAVLDVNLIDGDISAVAERLAQDAVPCIFQTGVGLPANLATRFPNLVVQIKPCVSADTIRRLASMISSR